jgi:hypothetical protein
VIDPVQSDKANEGQIDGHREAHDPGSRQQHSGGYGSDREQRLGGGEVHPQLIATSLHARRPEDNNLETTWFERETAPHLLVRQRRARAAYDARYASTAWATKTLALNKPRIAVRASII